MEIDFEKIKKIVKTIAEQQPIGVVFGGLKLDMWAENTQPVEPLRSPTVIANSKLCK
jgi:hypothetical protein